MFVFLPSKLGGFFVPKKRRGKIMQKKENDLELGTNRKPAFVGASADGARPRGVSSVDLIDRTKMGSSTLSREQELMELVRPISQEEASFSYRELAYVYPDFIKIFKANTRHRKLIPGFEASTKQSNSGLSEPINKALSEFRSIRRAKQKVRDLIICNDFELFCTFTIATNRQDIAKSKTKIQNWFKNQRSRKGKICYLAVPEFHPKALKEGREELHFHILIKGFTGELREAINPKNGKSLKRYGRQFYNIPSFTLGFTKVQYMDTTPETKAKISNYVSKYITKDMPQFFGKNRYYASKNLIRPQKIYNPPPWFRQHPLSQKFINDYGETQFFLRTEGMVEDGS
jgi:hypothetical protein